MTPEQIFDDTAALLNDQIQSVFTDAVLLPYYNMALQVLQETFELNNIPVTNETSLVLPVASGINRIAFSGTIPLLPGDLIDIRQLWESPSGINTWTPMTKKEFLPHYLENGQSINQFLVYSWINQEIKLIAANAANDLKLDYIKSILPRITISQIIEPISVLNVSLFLTNWTAGLAAYFIGENESRAETLYGLANSSLERSLGISVKGMQAVQTRRRPFRAAYKSRTIY
jgi:hypothetical protein